MTDALDPLIRIANRLKSEAEDLGLAQVHFSVHPSLDGGDHFVQVAYSLKEKGSIEPSTPGIAFASDPGFDEIARRLEGEIEAQQQAEEAKAQEQESDRLRDFFKELNDPGKGIGLGDA